MRYPRDSRGRYVRIPIPSKRTPATSKADQSSNLIEQQASMAESTEDIRNQLAGLAEAVTGLIEWHQKVKVELGPQISSLMAAIEAQRVVLLYYSFVFTH